MDMLRTRAPVPRDLRGRHRVGTQSRRAQVGTQAEEPLADAVRTALSASIANSAPPKPAFDTIEARLAKLADPAITHWVEEIYAGATFVTKGHSFRTYDWNRSTNIVQGLLDTYDLDTKLAAAA